MRRARLSLLAIFSIAAAGCAHRNTGAGAAGPPSIPVSYPVQREVTDYAEYTGRTAAINSVTVVPYVTGYIVKIPFKEGSEVKKGDVLFEIDPRTYEALAAQAKAQVALNQAQLKLAEANYERDKIAGGAVTPQQLDIDLATVQQNAASVKAAQAALEVAQVNLGYAHVKSPIDGRVGYYYLTLGNLAIQDVTQLTTVVSQDPMYAYFDVDEPTVLKVRDLIQEGKFKSIQQPGVHIPVYLGLANEEGYPHEGELDFTNNMFTPTTATLQVRGIFKNPTLTGALRLISPGMFVRVRVPVSPPHPALLVSQAAIGTDQTVNYVYVVGDDNKIVRKNVTLGALNERLQAITKGIEPTDRIVVNGLQQVRPGMTVHPDPIPMPTPPPLTPPERQPTVLMNPAGAPKRQP